MGGNGVNFNAPKDTTGVNRVNMQNIQRAAGQGAVKGGINSIFTHGKGSTGHVGGRAANYEGSKTHTDFQNGVPVGHYEGNGEYSGKVSIDGTVHFVAKSDEEGKSTDLKDAIVNGEASYEGDNEVKGEIE